MRTTIRLSLLISVAIAANACASSGASATATPSTPTPTATPAPTAAPTPAPTTRATARPTPAPVVTTLYDPTADARADIAAALSTASSDGKRVLIDFGADWCPDCHALDAYLHGASGTALVDRAFHVVKVDVGMWDHNLDVSADYGDPILSGIPAVVVLEPDGTVVGSSADGSLASASGMTERQVLDYLTALAPS